MQLKWCKGALISANDAEIRQIELYVVLTS